MKTPRNEVLRLVFLVGILLNAGVLLYQLRDQIHDPLASPVDIVNSVKAAAQSNVGSKLGGKVSASSGKESAVTFSVEDFDKHFKYDLDFLNATAIFNEVNNALKQKNSDLNPIGVSFFPAYILPGTHLYHATHGGSGEIPTSYEWVAMDYEFSYSFAHFPRNKPRGGGPGGHGGPPGGGRHRGGPPGGGKHHGGGPPGFGNGASHMLTFEVTKPLDRLLYLGGASAAKTDTGEMDTQYVLMKAESYDDFDERTAADAICKWGKKFGGIDGYVRLEDGFEIVICDFFTKMKLIENTTMTNLTNTLDFPPENFNLTPAEDPLNAKRSSLIDELDAMSGFEQAIAGARVYDGDKRILLDFTKFVTPLGKTFIDPDPYTRRIYNLSDDIKDEMVAAVGKGLETVNDPYQATNWQKVTEGIEAKFGPLLANLNSSLALYARHNDYGILGSNLTTYSFNYIRRYLTEPNYNLDGESRRMAIWDYVHPYHAVTSASELLIFQSLTVVQTRIVDTINEAFELGRDLLGVYKGDDELANDVYNKRIAEMTATLRTLLDDLRWSLFYQCSNTCGSDEICLIPTWGPGPFGWGGKIPGLATGDDGITRIQKECNCVSYRTILDLRSK